MNAGDLIYCKCCWVPSTRPRVTFSERGWCNACEWNFEKKTLNWQERWTKLEEICDRYRHKDGSPDVIVGFSGGKDSLWVAYSLKEKLGMHPLLVTIMPHLETEIGKWNRENLCTKESGFERLNITLKEDKYRDLAKFHFEDTGRPKHPWETAISAVIINQAVKLGIPFIMYGEEGEMEYGGSSREKDRWMLPCDKEYLMKFYWQEKLDWDIPSDEEFSKIFFTQFSRFENWSPIKHAEFAKSKGMETLPTRSIGTFTNDCQLSDKMQDLHVYLMGIKFGFGRCTSDVCIAIREGWIERDEGLELIENYDGEFPQIYLNDYLDYFRMTKQRFNFTILKHANTEILERSSDSLEAAHVWNLQSWVAKKRRQGTKLEFINPTRYDFL